MEEKLGFRYPSVTADAGYESEEGNTYLRENVQAPYIKPQTYEQQKKRRFRKTSANGKTWNTMKPQTPIPAMPESR